MLSFLLDSYVLSSQRLDLGHLLSEFPIHYSHHTESTFGFQKISNLLCILNHLPDRKKLSLFHCDKHLCFSLGTIHGTNGSSILFPFIVINWMLTWEKTRKYPSFATWFTGPFLWQFIHLFCLRSASLKWNLFHGTKKSYFNWKTWKNFVLGYVWLFCVYLEVCIYPFSSSGTFSPLL